MSGDDKIFIARLVNIYVPLSAPSSRGGAPPVISGLFTELLTKPSSVGAEFSAPLQLFSVSPFVYRSLTVTALVSGLTVKRISFVEVCNVLGETAPPLVVLDPPVLSVPSEGLTPLAPC